jgi:AraC family transcriptional regulator
MSTTDPQSLIVAERPFFTTRERLDDQRSLSSVSFAHGDLSVARYRRDRPGLGLSTSNPIAAMFMAVVILRPLPAHAGWRDGHPIDIPEYRTGTLACLDLRESWTTDLAHPFDSFHAFIPITAFDEITSELKRPRIERLSCPNTVGAYDETMLGLARALNPLMARPGEATALFTDHLFAAMVAHLAVTYGGLDRADIQADGVGKRGTLTHLQQRRVTSRLLDNLKDDPSLSELASLCGLSRSHFIRAFKQTTGLPPHRWLMMQRVSRARALLVGSEMPISLIALECGFADQSHFTRVFSRVFGRAPGALRRHLRD